MSRATESDAAPGLMLRLPATPASPTVLRAGIREWLWELGATDQDSVDLQLACTEALARVIDQAATPVALVVDVDGTFEADMLTITMREYGLCRNGDGEPAGHETLGLALIQAMVDVFDVRAHPDGRTIVLGRKARLLAA